MHGVQVAEQLVNGDIMMLDGHVVHFVFRLVIVLAQVTDNTTLLSLLLLSKSLQLLLLSL